MFNMLNANAFDLRFLLPWFILSSHCRRTVVECTPPPGELPEPTVRCYLKPLPALCRSLRMECHPLLQTASVPHPHDYYWQTHTQVHTLSHSGSSSACHPLHPFRLPPPPAQLPCSSSSPHQ